MKLFAVATLFFGMIVSFNAQAAYLKCVESKSTGASLYELEVDVLETITDEVSWGKEYDDVSRVKVDIYEVAAGKRTLTKSFDAIMNSVDVVVNILAVRKEGFRFWRYLDEDHQDGFSLKSADGKISKHKLECEQE